MYRFRMLTPSASRELLDWFRELAAPLAQKGLLLSVAVNDADEPDFVDVGFEGRSVLAEREVIAQCVSDFLGGPWKSARIRQSLEQEREDLSADEMEDLCQQVGRSLEKAEGGAFGPELVAAVEEAMRATNELNLDGFLRFRRPDCVRSVAERTRATLDQFFLRKQYEEFVSVLSYFVETTPSRRPLIHVVCRGDAAVALDETKRPLDLSQIEAVALHSEVDDVHPQDVVMSALIAQSPEHVLIHAPERGSGFARTVSQVFGERANWCPSCGGGCEVFLSVIDKDSGRLYTTI